MKQEPEFQRLFNEYREKNPINQLEHPFSEVMKEEIIKAMKYAYQKGRLDEAGIQETFRKYILGEINENS